MKIFYILLIALLLGACVSTKPKVEEFTVDFNSPRIAVGEANIQVDRFLSIGSLRKIKAAVSYVPREDAVCLQYKTELTTYYQYWSREGREAFINALLKYNEDYLERRLVRKNRQTRAAYGFVKGYLIWQFQKFSIRAKATTDIELGYAFKDKFPYFIVFQDEAEYIDPVGRDNNRTTPIFTMFFTRAQAEELAGFFDQTFLIDISSDLSRTRITGESDIDEY